MSLSYRSSGKTPRIGFLLSTSDIVRSQQLEEAAEVARTSNQPIGRVLLMLGSVNERNLKSALLAQSLISQGLMSLEYAADVLKVAAHRQIPLDAVLEELNWKTADAGEAPSELGELLLEAGFIDRAFLNEATASARHSDVLLGRFLLIRAALTSQMLGAALEALAHIGNERVSRDEAVSAMREVREKRCTFQEACKSLGISTGDKGKHLKLGKMLTSSGVISDAENLHALELALMEKRKLGQILSQAGLVSQPMLEAAIALQELTSKDIISHEEAGLVMALMKNQDWSFEEAKKEILSQDANPELTRKAIDLLKSTGTLTDADLQRATEANAHYDMPPSRALVAAEIIDRGLYNAAVDVLDLIENQDLKMDQAFSLLQWCHRSRCTLQEALDELNLGSTFQLNRAGKTYDNLPAVGGGPSANAPGHPEPAAGLSFGTKEWIQLGALLVLCGGLLVAILNLVPSSFQAYALGALMLMLAVSVMIITKQAKAKKAEAHEKLNARISSASVVSDKLRRRNAGKGG